MRNMRVINSLLTEYSMEFLILIISGECKLSSISDRISCGLNFKAFDWCEQYLMEVLTGFHGRSILALMPRAIAPTNARAGFFPLEADRLVAVKRYLLLARHRGVTSSHMKCLFP